MNQSFIPNPMQHNPQLGHWEF